MSRILLVEDEESFSDPLSFLLRREGFDVAVAETGTAGLAEFDANGADLVLLDLMLPGLSGLEVCRALRQRSSVPVIMLTAKDDEIDKVVGLELGADDYVTKPYSSRELLARIRAVLRRHAEPEELLAPTLEAGPVRMDVERHTVAVNGVATAAAAQGVRAAGDAAAQRGAGAHPRPAHRPGLGQRLRRRHQDPGCAHQAAAQQDRGRPGRTRGTSRPSAVWATSSSRKSADPGQGGRSSMWRHIRLPLCGTSAALPSAAVRGWGSPSAWQSMWPRSLLARASRRTRWGPGSAR